MLLLSRYFSISPRTTVVHVCTYLLGVCLFSISFLVFLNSVVSFVITDLIGIKDGVGDLVGTLGFVDELVALVACPIWGALSDRVGVRYVCVAGYTIIGLSLFIFVQARDVYPQLLLARALFSVGGAATATMVTGILPSISTNEAQKQPQTSDELVTPTDHIHRTIPQFSDLQDTITATNHNEDHSNYSNSNCYEDSNPSRLAGLVGLFTGSGALVALILFLPLPAWLSTSNGITQAHAVADSFYIVGTVSLAAACVCFWGLRGLNGEEGKGLHLLFGKRSPLVYQPILSDQNDRETIRRTTSTISYWQLLLDSTTLGLRDSQIGLGYIGGFVARASSVGISLFIPTYVNAFFLEHGLCDISPTDPSSKLKEQCRTAYVLASELTGVSQLIALLCAPVFGYLSDRYRRFHGPLLFASFLGIIGYIGFARLASPEIKNIDGRGGSPIVFLIVSLIGISQIGAIVCSLGLLSHGVMDSGHIEFRQTQNTLRAQNYLGLPESTPLMPLPPEKKRSRSYLKGSIAGIYSLSGSTAILILTKLGGLLFDKLSISSPFYIMAIFNSILLFVGLGIGIHHEFRTRARQKALIM